MPIANYMFLCSYIQFCSLWYVFIMFEYEAGVVFEWAFFICLWKALYRILNIPSCKFMSPIGSISSLNGWLLGSWPNSWAHKCSIPSMCHWLTTASTLLPCVFLVMALYRAMSLLSIQMYLMVGNSISRFLMYQLML